MQNSIENVEQFSTTDQQHYVKQCRLNKLSLLKETLNFLKDNDQLSLTWPKVTIEDENLLSSLLYMAKPVESYNSHENSIYCVAIYEVVKNKSKDFVFNINIESAESVFKRLTIVKTCKEEEVPEEIQFLQDHPEDCVYQGKQIAVINNWQEYLNKQKSVSSSKPIQNNNRNEKVVEMRVNKGLDKRNKDLNKAFAVPVNATKAARMMRLMGWSGGALGRTGDGIVEPIVPYLTATPGTGLGCTPKEPNSSQHCNTNNSNNSKKGAQQRMDSIRLLFLNSVRKLYENQNSNMVEMKIERRVNNKEITELKKICTAFNTQEGLNIFTDSELDLVLQIQNIRNDQAITITHNLGPQNRTTIFLLKDMPHAYKNNPVPKKLLETKQTIRDFENLFTSTLLSFLQNPGASHVFTVELTRKVIIAATKVLRKCVFGRVSRNDSPAMLKAIQLAQADENQLILLKFDQHKKAIQLNKIYKSPSAKKKQFFDKVCRDDEVKFKTDFYKLVLLVLKDQSPQRYIDLGSPITEDEAKTAEDIIKWLNDRQRPVSPHTSHQQILIIDEILQILSGNPLIVLVLDISVNKQYLRITKQFKLANACPLPVVVIHSMMNELFKREMFQAFINFLENDDKSFILKFKITPVPFMVKHYSKIKMFLTNRKPVTGIGKEIETLNLYSQLQTVVYSGPDYGILQEISSDKRSITITKEPRFMTEVRMTRNNKQKNEPDVSDESDDDEGSMQTGSTDTGTGKTDDRDPECKIIQVNHISDIIQDKIYELRNDSILNMKMFLKNINEKSLSTISVNKNYQLEKFAIECKFLVTLECFLRETWKENINLLTEDGFLVATTFSNAVIKDFNLGTQCSFSKNEILSNLFQRLLIHDYCKLKAENQLSQICITKIKNKQKKKSIKNKTSTILNIDDDISIIEEKIETVDLTEDNESNKYSPTENLCKAIEVIECDKSEANKNDDDVIFINTNNDNYVNLVDNDISTEVDLTKEDNDVVCIQNDDYISVNKHGFNFLEALSKRDYLLLYVPYSEMFKGFKYCSNFDVSTNNNNYVKRICNRKWYPKDNQAIINTQLNVNDDISNNDMDDVSLTNDVTKCKNQTLVIDQNHECMIKDSLIKSVEKNDVSRNSVMAVYEIIANTFERLDEKVSISHQQDQAGFINNNDRKTEDTLLDVNKDVFPVEFIGSNNAMLKDQPLTSNTNEYECISDNNSNIPITNIKEAVDKYKIDNNKQLSFDIDKINLKDVGSNDSPINVDEFDKDEVIFIKQTSNDIERITNIIANETIDVDEYVDEDTITFISELILCDKDKVDIDKYSNNAFIVTNVDNNSTAKDNLQSINLDKNITNNSDLFVEELISNRIECNTSDVKVMEIDETLDSNKNMDTAELFNKSDCLGEGENINEPTPNKNNSEAEGNKCVATYEPIPNNKLLALNLEQTSNNDLIDNEKDQNMAMNESESGDIVGNPYPSTVLASSKRFHSDSPLTKLNGNKKFKQVLYDSKKLKIMFYNSELKIDNDVASKIQIEILNQIDDTKFVPMLKCLHLKNGKLFYKIKDECSYNWLKTVISNFQINGEKFQLTIDDELSEKIEIVMRFNSFIEESCEVILNRITQFNKDIKTMSWKVLNQFSFGSNIFYHFEIDLESFIILRDHKFCLNLGVDMAYFDKNY